MSKNKKGPAGIKPFSATATDSSKPKGVHPVDSQTVYNAYQKQLSRQMSTVSTLAHRRSNKRLSSVASIQPMGKAEPQKIKDEQKLIQKEKVESGRV